MKGLEQNCFRGDASGEIYRKQEKNQVIFFLRPPSTFWQSATRSEDAAEPISLPLQNVKTFC